MKSYTVTANGIRHFVIEEGESAPVILLHGFPETHYAGREHIWLRHFFSDWTFDPSTISGEAFDTYVPAYQAPGAVRGAMADYCANT